ncbi:MAG: class A sortase [Clostridiales bacterium]|nr:class A sortase [Clostridiales bacterium]
MEEITAEEIAVNQERKAEFDYSVIEDLNISTAIEGALQVDWDYMIGVMEIPDLNIELPILKGVTRANLMVGVTTMKEDQSMGDGNYPLAGHYVRSKEMLLADILDIEIGSSVFLTDKKTIYEYRIYDTAIVPDTATEMLSDKLASDHGKPIVSIMTCYYSSKTGKRFFALGELVGQYPVDSPVDKDSKENQGNIK